MANQLIVKVQHKESSEALPGTVAWLLANVGHIDIGRNTAGCQGAWLKDKGGKNITVLAIRGYFPDEGVPDPSAKVVRVSKYVEAGEDDENDLTADMAFTKAAWKVIQQLAAAAAEEMDRALAVEDFEGETVTVEVRRTPVPPAKAPESVSVSIVEVAAD